MSPKEILQRAQRETFLDADEEEMDLARRPGLDDEGIADAEATIGAPLPSEIEELLRFTSGVDFGSHEISFVPEFSFGMEHILPRVSPLMDDGYGNFWLVEIANDGRWGPVFFCSHDPPVLMVQSADLATFIDELLAMGRPERQSQLDFVHDEAAARAWRSDEHGQSAHALANAADPALRAFARTLDADDLVFDLRARTCGSGFAWGRHGPRTRVTRHDAELIFAVRTK